MSLIYELWPPVALEIGPILKGQRNVQQGYEFRGVDDVFAKAHLPIFKAGLTVESELRSWEARDYTRTRVKGNREEEQHFYQVFVDMRYTITAPDGSSIHADALGASIDYQDKAANQAMSQAIKMALIQLVLSPTGQVDADARAPHREAAWDAEPAEPDLSLLRTHLEKRPPVEKPMQDHQAWVRSLFGLCAAAGLQRWLPSRDGVDALHRALAGRAADHLADLKRDQLLEFVEAAATAAEAELPAGGDEAEGDPE